MYSCQLTGMPSRCRVWKAGCCQLFHHRSIVRTALATVCVRFGWCMLCNVFLLWLISVFVTDSASRLHGPVCYRLVMLDKDILRAYWYIHAYVAEFETLTYFRSAQLVLNFELLFYNTIEELCKKINIAYRVVKLQLVKVIKLDANGSLVLSNSVTFF